MKNNYEEKNLKKCPFCGEGALYITRQEDELGTEIPSIFCNLCKVSIVPEDDSNSFDDDEIYNYLLDKVVNVWNSRGKKVKVRRCNNG